MRKYSPILLIALLGYFLLINEVKSQTHILERTVKHDTLTPKFGKNRKHYANVLFSAGFIVSPSQNIDIKYGAAMEYALGGYYKRRLNKKFSVGATLMFRSQTHRLKNSLLPIASNYTGEFYRFTLPTFELAPFLRFNFDKLRGDHLGTFLDLSAGAGVPVWVDYSQELKNNTNSTKEFTSISNLPYLTPIHGFVEARLGYRSIVIYTHWRLNNVFISSKLNEMYQKSFDLPKATVGLMVAF